LKLQSNGIVDVVPIKRTDWLKVASGIGSIDYWQNRCKPEVLFKFYFEEVDKKVKKLRQQYGKPVILIGHSAGGWLARAMLSNGEWINSEDYSNSSSDLVIGLVTLGTPHSPPCNGVRDMTGGCLKFVDSNYPGSFLQKKSIFYVTVSGKAVQGNATALKGSSALFASKSYLQLTGNSQNNGNEVGDGVVPTSISHLKGAVQVTLANVYHSINAPNNYWYGGPEVVKQWFPQVALCLDKTVEDRDEKNKNKIFQSFRNFKYHFDLKKFTNTILS
jgi:hypothetical protein